MKTRPSLLTEAFAKFIRASQSGRRRLPNGRKLSPGTLENYRQTLRILKNFESTLDHPLLLHHAGTRITQPRHKQLTRYWKTFAAKFRQFLCYTSRFSDAYAASHLKNLTTLFHYLSKEKGWNLHPYTPYFSHPHPDTPPLVLEQEQIAFLAADPEFISGLTPPLQRARILFLFGCFTALRFSDLSRLKRSQLVTLNGKPGLKLVVKKTGQFLDIPLPAVALPLLNQWQAPANRFLLPRLSSVNFNRQLKKLFAKAGWYFPFPKYQSKKGQLTELKKEDHRSWQFNEQITSHTMRRTAITTLLRQGVSENLVRCLSGHSPSSREFHKYVSLSKNWLDHEIREAWGRVIPSHY